MISFKHLISFFLPCFILIILTSCADSNKDSKSDEIITKIYAISDDINEANIEVGIITFRNAPNNDGLSIQTKLKLPGIKKGTYGFHIHNNPSCDPDLKDGKMTAGMAAGGHLDPDQTTKHLGPYDLNGHLGDLPLLVVDNKGEANNILSAPKLKLSDIINRSVMIHAGSDNYSDEPMPLGGGGPRKFCGVIKAP